MSDSMSDSELLEAFLQRYKLEEDTAVMYTDGSKVEDATATGASIVVENKEEAYTMSIDNKCSIFTAEAIAVEKALGLVEDMKINRDILILTDSKSTCEAISNNRLTADKNQYIMKIKERIASLCQDTVGGEGKDKNRKVVIGWIPSHAGIKGNEIADGLAKEAAQEEADGRIKISEQDWKIVFKDQMFRATEEEVVREGLFKETEYFSRFFKEGSLKPWFSKVMAKRNFINMVNRLRSGHVNTNQSLARTGYVAGGCGHKMESVIHILFECENFIAQREEFYKGLERINIKYPFCIEEWLEKPELGALEETRKFLKKINRIL